MSARPPESAPVRRYDVFLSHSSRDKPIVERLAVHLRDSENLDPFLDKWNLIPGQPWQEELENALRNSRAVAILVGDEEFGPWHHEEMRTVIAARVNQGRGGFAVIPVLLPGVPPERKAGLPSFLQRYTWVDFAKGIDDAESMHRLVCGIKGIPPEHAPGQVEAGGVCPYRGLEAFDESSARFFFGREALVDWILDQRIAPMVGPKHAARLLAVLGASGSGKSSLVKAGLVPALRKGSVIAGSAAWPIAILRPLHDPIESLATALAKLEGAPSAVAIQGLRNALRTDASTLHLTARLTAEAKAAERVVIVVDQFEEVFTLCKDPANRRAFVDNLLEAASRLGGSALVILTMRIDFLGKCSEDPRLASALSDHQEIVPPLGPDDLRRAIEEPARRVGTKVDAGLDDVLVAEMKDNPGSLPLLQFTLQELWNKTGGARLSVDDYRDFGGIAGALQRKADGVLADLGKDPRKLALCRRIFLNLTEPGAGTEDTKRRASISELIAKPEESVAIEEVVQELKDARLVTSPRDSGSAIEVSHEALIRGWPTLRSWIEEDRRGLMIKTELRDTAGDWNDHQRDASYLYTGSRLEAAREWSEQHPDDVSLLERAFLDACLAAKKREEERSRRRFQVVAGVALVAVIAAVVAGWMGDTARRERNRAQDAEKKQGELAGERLIALVQAKESETKAKESEAKAEEREREAVRQQRIAEARRLAAESLASQDEPQTSVLLAVESIRATRDHDQTVVPVAHQRLIDSLQQIGGRALTGHRGPVTEVAYLPDGKRVVTASWDGTARVWDLTAPDPGAAPVVLQGHTGWVNALAIHRDGKRVVTAGGDNKARVWDLTAVDPNAAPIVLAGHTEPIHALAIHPDGRRVVTAGDDNTVRVWDLEAADPSAAPFVLRGHTGPIYALAIHPDGNRVVTASDDNSARVWDLTAADPSVAPTVLVGHNDGINAIAIHPDGKRVATAGDDKTVRVWDLTAADPSAAPILLEGHTASINAVAIHPDGKRVVSAGDDSKARVWDLTAADPNAAPIVLKGHTGSITALAIHHDGIRVVTASHDKTARVWDLTAADPNAAPIVLKGHTSWINALAIHPNRERVVTAGLDSTPRVWDPTADDPGAAPTVIRGHDGSIEEFSIHPDGERVVTASWDGTGRVWKLAAADPGFAPLVLEGHTGPIYALAIDRDGNRVVTAGFDKTARVWDLRATDRSAAPIVLRGHTEKIVAVVMHPDGRGVVTASEDGTVRVWDLEAPDPISSSVLTTITSASSHLLAIDAVGSRVVTAHEDHSARVWDLLLPGSIAPKVLKGHTGLLSALAIHPDGKRIVTGSLDKTARVWDLTAPDPNSASLVLVGHTDPITAIAIHPDGERVVTASDDETVRIWNLNAADPNAASIVLRGHAGLIDALAIHADGKRVVTGSLDKTARVWDLTAPDPSSASLVLVGHTGAINALAIHPDGKRVVTASSDKTVRVWTIDVDALIAIARKTTGRNPTMAEWIRYQPGASYRRTFDSLPFPRDFLPNLRDRASLAVGCGVGTYGHTDIPGIAAFFLY
ncbi:MAG: TIR domain-containing protein [Isosphaeraceae bacterium]|nr:TIR domain-containing protein [Isosphaeraceae bacterium]